MSLEFQSLEYSIHDPYSITGKKQILKKINGTFQSNQLTAILGASGAGKTTLLNVLAGLLSDGRNGKTSYNGTIRDMATFKKISCYVAQEDHLRPFLSVSESMDFATNLKLSSKISRAERKRIKENILITLGLTQCHNTRTESLSGGQRKRLSLALELLNNPPIIFLDEPTTGLDCVSATKCIEMIKGICLQDRLVVCTVHQPSKLIFDTFDQVYFLSGGQCIYNGSPSNIVNHLSALGLDCPLLWNIADYLIEVSNDESTLLKLKDSCHNGRVTSIIPPSSKRLNEETCRETCAPSAEQSPSDFPVPFSEQLLTLLTITFLQTTRNRKFLYVNFFIHVLLGLVIGGLFFHSSNDASKALPSFFFFIAVVMFYIYVYAMTSVLIFPSEVDIFKREYSNRWYSLKAYYGMLVMRNIPLIIVFGFVFNSLVYFLSNQIMDLYYFSLFSFTTIIISLASESLGTFIGSIFNVLHGSVAVTAFLAPLVIFSLYGIGYGTRIHPAMEIIISFSYIRSGFIALCQLMFSKQGRLKCPEPLYCYYRYPQQILHDMGMGNKKFYLEIIYIILFTVAFRILGYLALRLRTRADLEQKIKSILSYRITNICKISPK